MFNANRENGSDNQYRIEPLEARRFLSVTASDGEAPVDEPAPDTTEYTDLTDSSEEGTYEITSDEVAIGDGSENVSDGTEVEILYMTGGEGDTTGITEDGNIICYMTGEIIGAVRTQHPLNPEASSEESTDASPPPDQAAGFIKAAETGAVTKSVLGSSSDSVLS